MRSKLFQEQPKTAQTSKERWIRIFPDVGEGYRLYDALAEKFIGRILFDKNDFWIYDGEILTVLEQEEVAGMITGHQREMELLIKDII